MKGNVMLKRIITALVAICVLVPALIFSHTWFFPIAISFFLVGALFEIFKCLGKEKKLCLTIPAYIFGAFSPFLLRIDSIRGGFYKVAFIFAIFYLAYLFALCVFSKGELKFGEISELFVLSAYIISAFDCIIYLRDIELGKYIYLLIFIGAWTTDTFAYFTGMIFGKHKLIPEVSPKKTIEGSVGGAIFSCLAFILFGIIITVIDKSIEVNYIFLAI